jgi:hypothetical protein
MLPTLHMAVQTADRHDPSGLIFWLKLFSAATDTVTRRGGQRSRSADRSEF